MKASKIKQNGNASLYFLGEIRKDKNLLKSRITDFCFSTISTRAF